MPLVVAVVVVVAGLEAAVVLVAGLEAVVAVVVLVAGLEVVVGGLGATDGVCASATDAIAKRTMSDLRSVFIRRLWPGSPRNVKLGQASQVQRLLLLPQAQ